MTLADIQGLIVSSMSAMAIVHALRMPLLFAPVDKRWQYLTNRR